MKNRRVTTTRTLPAYEDAGLFQKPLVSVRVDLIPEVRRNLRQDILVQGFAGAQQKVMVVFAGRRAKQAGPLLRKLMLMGSHARQGVQGFSTNPETMPRLHVLIEGAWRVKFNRDETGWESKHYHLMAARWSVAESGAFSDYKGALPAI